MEVKERVTVQVRKEGYLYSGSMIELEFVDSHKELKYQKRDALYIEWLTSVPCLAVEDVLIKTLSVKESELTPELRLLADWLAKAPE